MPFINQIKRLITDDGLWAVYIVARLAVNKLRVTTIRILLRVPDIYFQGSPKIVGRHYIRFGRNFRCGRGAWIEALSRGVSAANAAEPRIIIGDNFNASDNLHIGALTRIEIGENVLIGSGVLITDHAHGAYRGHGDSPTISPSARSVVSNGSVNISRNVWIGDGVKILSGVSIGEGSVVGANTVVRRDIPRGVVYVGSRVVRAFDFSSESWSRVGENSE